jgi:TRAP-type C4-dicarboxylate transport system permease small subunit
VPAFFCRRGQAEVSVDDGIVLQAQRHLKWRSFDVLERIIMVLCGICLTGFVTSVFFDIVTRTIGRPWLWLQEVTSTFFIYGVFIGAGVAIRRADHLYLTAISESMHGRTRLATEIFNRCVVLFAAFCMMYFGVINVVQGLGNFRMPSMTPLSTFYAAIPLSGFLVALFTIEQLVNGWRHGFEGDPTKAGDQKHVMR